MKILDILQRESKPFEISDEFCTPYKDIRYPSRYKKLASYTLNWHTRNVMESVARPTMFVTFTYNEDYYLEKRLIDNDIRKTLKDDWSRFYKRLRRYLEYYDLPVKDFSYYCISERGDDGRLHFHALIFGFPFQSYPGKNAKGQRVDYVKFNEYTNIIDKAWHQGFTFYEAACPENIKYVTKYIHKRMISCDYVSLKSKGLGLAYLTESRKNFLHNNKATKLRIGNQVYYLPRYLKQKIFNEEELREVNEQIALEKRQKIELKKPASFDQNTNYVYYHNTLQFFSSFRDGKPAYAQFNEDLKNIPFEQILLSVDESVLTYDELNDSFLALPCDDWLQWYYLRQRNMEDCKMKDVYNKRL